MLTVCHNDTTFTLPGSAEELTLSQYLGLEHALSNRAVLQLLASDSAALFELPAGADSELINALSWVAELPDYTAATPTRTVGGQIVPDALNLLPLRLKWLLDDLLTGNGETPALHPAVSALAVYLYEPMTGKPLTDAAQLPDFLPIINALPAHEALPVAAFFLRTYQQPISFGAISSQNKSQPNRLTRWLRKTYPNLARMLSSRSFQPSPPFAT